jgi:hypothetical protein
MFVVVSIHDRREEGLRNFKIYDYVLGPAQFSDPTFQTEPHEKKTSYAATNNTDLHQSNP